jgi:tripeptide aminopeptidase
MSVDYIDLLEKTLAVQSKSGQEKRMKKYIRNYLRELGLDTEHDNMGNIYCHKGDKRRNRPFVVAHMDTVHDINGNYQVFKNDTFFSAFDTLAMKQLGVGGDDKVGIWAALAAITVFDNISVAFFVKEEIGCIGSNGADKKQFDRANWMAQLDRRGATDFIVAKMASQEFIDAMKPMVEEHGMEVKDQSTITDVSTLWRNGVGVSAVNIASGYWYPHTDNEVVNIDDATISLNLLFEMINQYGDTKFEHVYVAPKPKPRPKYQKNTWNHRDYSSKYPTSVSSYYRNLPAKFDDDEIDEVPVIAGLMRVWSSVNGCYEWCDASDGNVMFYEGSDQRAQTYSLDAYYVKGYRFDPPKYATVSANLPTMKMLHESNLVDLRGMSSMFPEHDKANTDFDLDVKTDGVDPLPFDDDGKSYEEEASAKDWRDLEKKIHETNNRGSEEVMSYHNYEEEYYSATEARKMLEGYLSLFGYTYTEFVQGLIPDVMIRNLSASLYNETNKTLYQYAEKFNAHLMYEEESLTYCGPYESFNNRDFLSPNHSPIPY